MTDVLVLERLARNAALGVRFRDIATGATAIDGLDVQVYPRANPRARTNATVSPSGVYVAHAVRGLREFEYLDADPDLLWTEPARPCRIEVRDPEGRYLPMAFDADLPARGLLTWAAPWFSPPAPIAPPLAAGSPAQLALGSIPLFSAPSRPVPDPLAAVYAQLRESGSGLPGAWLALGVSIDGVRRGLGLADGEGRVAVLFAYPEPPRVSLASPPESRNDFTWELEFEAFGAIASPAVPPAPIAELADVLAALAAPRAVLDSAFSPSLPMRLAYRQPLVARTAGAAAADASFLLVS